MLNLKNYPLFFHSNYLFLAIISLTALFATFIVSNLDLKLELKSLIFLVIVFLYLMIYLNFYASEKQKFENLISAEETRLSDSVFNSVIENRLLALEEASEFFGASLKFPDMFRLISSRINELIPFKTCAFFIVDETRTNIKIVCSVGENMRELLNFETKTDQGLAGKTFLTKEIQFEEKIITDKNILPESGLSELESALSVPLFQKGEIYGILNLYGSKDLKFDEKSIQLLEAIGVRIAPLFLSSMAFEKSVANALTDSLTKLPNTRAFYLVLENQIAECERSLEESRLTLLTIDIKGFNDLNLKFGHATGDKILIFAAKLIKDQLRQMDFLARSESDEFLVILPISSVAITQEIIFRIENEFKSKKIGISETEEVEICLNFGAAIFDKDSDNSNQLLQIAHFRKQQSKTVKNNKVILFPGEYLN